MARSRLDVKGFEEYLEKLAQAGADVDSITDEALKEGGEILRAGMEARAPEDQGHLKSKIEMQGPVNDGNFHYVKVGMFNVDREKEMYFFYQENGSPRNAPHPYIRPTFNEDMKKARAKMLEVFKSRGAL